MRRNNKVNPKLSKIIARQKYAERQIDTWWKWSWNIRNKIIYKEHPDTFAQGEPFYSPLYKDKNYWDKIFNYKDLNIISQKENIYETIDKSLMLVTQSSTTAIEAVIRGKPVLIFGNAWFSSCEGIFKIENYQDCVDAILKIKNGYKY